MGIRTGRQFLDGLKDSREIWLEGERVEDVTTHPKLGRMAHTLADLVSGRIAGRPDSQAVTLFESQGVAIEDVAAALHVYRKAREEGMGQELPF